MVKANHVPPDGTVNASITTSVQEDRLEALETLLTVQVARLAMDVPVGVAVVTPATARRMNDESARGCMMSL